MILLGVTRYRCSRSSELRNQERIRVDRGDQFGRISKRGNKYPRTLFVQAAHVVIERRPAYGLMPSRVSTLRGLRQFLLRGYPHAYSWFSLDDAFSNGMCISYSFYDRLSLQLIFLDCRI